MMRSALAVPADIALPTRAPATGRNRTTTDSPVSSNSGAGQPARSHSSIILFVPRPHRSMRPRRWNVVATSGLRGTESWSPFSFSTVTPGGSGPVLVTSRRSSQIPRLTAPPPTE